MKIALIDASPKPVNSNSALLLKAFAPMLDQTQEQIHIRISKPRLSEEQTAQLLTADAWVFAFPLYVDAIPSHLMYVLEALAQAVKKQEGQPIRVYALINNGFYEGAQNHIAFDILSNWCSRAGLCFGGGIGHGAGEMMGFIEKVPMDKGPLHALHTALTELAACIAAATQGKIVLLNPAFPHFAWKLMGTRFFWHATAKKNGLARKDILRQL